MRPRHAAAIALAVSAFATFSCGSQSHQQEAPPGESAVTSPKRTQANPGTATCAGGCPLEGIGLYDSAPGCYVGIIPEMKSYAAPPAGQRWEDSPKEGPPFPEAKAEVCFESAQFGMQLHTVNVTTASPEWNSFFDEGRLDLLTKGYGLDSTVDLQIEGYLGGAATWANLEWTCKTTIPRPQATTMQASVDAPHRARAGCRILIRQSQRSEGNVLPGGELSRPGSICPIQT